MDETSRNDDALPKMLSLVLHSIFWVTIFIIDRDLRNLPGDVLECPFNLGPSVEALHILLALLLLLNSLPARAAEKTRLRVDDYQIDAELTPHAHKIKARAKVKFTALGRTEHRDLSTAQRPAGDQSDGCGGQAPLCRAHAPRTSTVRVQLPEALSKDSFDHADLRIRGRARLGRRQSGAGAEAGVRSMTTPAICFMPGVGFR